MDWSLSVCMCIFTNREKKMALLPNRLRPGDTIGIIPPSSGVAALCPRRLQRGIAELERLGFNVAVGKHAQKQNEYMAGTVEERLEDLHDMFANPRIHAIMATIGGTCSHQLLGELDYTLIKHNPILTEEVLNNTDVLRRNICDEKIESRSNWVWKYC
ncbi:LD-carboxypeptidase [Anoxybacteroides rupiense]|uniref:LD-carboxypeptidase n=1 Tax=Anoxybacteroides rupiense TaxID=311460 RepID=UPI001F08D3EF|nr:LD-carboxypeptidase [Anoxybacillus rupiensis]